MVLSEQLLGGFAYATECLRDQSRRLRNGVITRRLADQHKGLKSTPEQYTAVIIYLLRTVAHVCRSNGRIC